MNEKEKMVIEEVINDVKQLTLITVGEIGINGGNPELRFSKLRWVYDLANDTINNLEDLEKGNIVKGDCKLK